MCKRKNKQNLNIINHSMNLKDLENEYLKFARPAETLKDYCEKLKQ